MRFNTDGYSASMPNGLAKVRHRLSATVKQLKHFLYLITFYSLINYFKPILTYLFCERIKNEDCVYPYIFSHFIAQFVFL